MIAFRRVLVAGVAVLALAAACSSNSAPAASSVPGSTLAPVSSVPGFTIAPGDLSSADPNGGVCALISAAEVGSIMGTTATVTDNQGDSCSFTLSTYASVSLTLSTDNLDTGRILLGNSATDINVGGLPGVSGLFIGQPMVFVQKGDQQLQVLGILTGKDDATRAKIVQIATTAVGRWQ